MDRRLSRPERVRRQRGVIAGIAAALLGAALIWTWVPSGDSADVAFDDLQIGRAALAPLRDYLPVRATVAPSSTTLVPVLTGGQVGSVLVEDGALVGKGQPLALLANDQLRREVMTQEVEIAARLGDISGQELDLERNRLEHQRQEAEAKFDLLKAQRDLATKSHLYAKGIVVKSAVDALAEEAAYHRQRLGQLQEAGRAESSIAAVEARRVANVNDRLLHNLSAVHAGLDALVLRAPAAGRLTGFGLQPGQTLKAGDPAGEVDSVGAWELVADVDEFHLGRLRPGQEGSDESGAMLAVRQVLPSVVNGRFKVKLAFRGAPPADLSRGQTRDVTIVLGATARALVVPAGAWASSAGNGAASVFVLDRDGRHARRRRVTLGRRNPDYVEIVSGLSPGDRIVTANAADFKADVLNVKGSSDATG